VIVPADLVPFFTAYVRLPACPGSSGLATASKIHGLLAALTWAEWGQPVRLISLLSYMSCLFTEIKHSLAAAAALVLLCSDTSVGLHSMLHHPTLEGSNHLLVSGSFGCSLRCCRWVTR